MAANTQSSSTPSCPPPRTAWSAILGRSGFSLALALLLFTALIWLRLRLVTDVPHRAYAQPMPQSHAPTLDPTPQAAVPAPGR